MTLRDTGHRVWIVPCILLGNWALLSAGMAEKSLWIDEWFTADIVRSPWDSLLTHIIDTERRPPLYYVLLKVWSLSAGDSEYVLHFYSIALTLLSVATAYTLGRRLLGHDAGLLGALLLGTSPFVTLYGRMARAYGQTMLLATLSTWLLHRALEKPEAKRLAAYGVAGLALLYTDYSGLAVVGGHGLYVLFCLISRQQPVAQWVGVASGLTIGYLPWIPATLAQESHPVRLTDLATGVAGFSLKLAYPFFAWGAGETILPWHPAALLGVIACGLLLVRGMVATARRDRAVFWLLAVLLAGPLLFTAFLLTLVATDIPFVNAASRSPAAAPVFYLGVAAGLASLRAPVLRALSALCISAAFVVALSNYYQGEQFHNPIYAVPISQVVKQVRTSSSPTDLIVAEADTLFGYYYQQAPGDATYQNADFDTNRAWIASGSPRRVWLVTFGRDGTRGVGRTEELADWLAGRYTLSTSWGYVPQAPLLQAAKGRLLGRPAYQYKLLLRLYVTP